ncbi:MAG: peroxide stress protein YaaA [Acidobacteriota bacterium]
MLMLLSPAKSLVEGSAVADLPATRPAMLDQTETLMKTTRRLSAPKLKELMGISDKLAVLNRQRFRDWTTPFTPENARQAVLTFNGDVYRGFDAGTLSGEDLAFAQEHLVILSGLYGALRPLDLIQPYRLEMGTQLKTRRGKNLYAFWGERITEQLNQLTEGHKDRTIVNLASNEYFSSVHPDKLAAPLVTPVFKDVKNGKARVLSFFAKAARGMMARWATLNRATTADQLRAFDGGGYVLQEALSTETRWEFHRPQPPPVSR